ncbi:hypothetical protein THRCLA_10775 [Thraustotheca clavata]|uniref:J domain-containing protein n=1 Tax=Thraustotheca clavata TaxID=74557 RepID=A0A1V9YHE2_9STRA|nr:hypothetical protein THRCLA_10775 [Thraustotheca clavata]
MSTKHTKYYELLGVSTEATAEELKKAYRRKALQLHPDKRGNTPEAQEEFTAMKAAYDVLSDPKQREVYDSMGEDGLKVMNDFGELSVEALVAAALGAFSALGPCAKFMIFLAILVAFGLAFMIPIFWCIRADKDVDWSWAVTFIPLWILDGLYVCWTGCSMAAGDEARDNDSPPIPWLRFLTKCVSFFHIVLFIVLQIFVAMKLQGSVDWSCGIVLVPLYILEGLFLAEKIAIGRRVYQAVKINSENGWMNVLVIEIGRSCLFSILRIAFEVLLALRVDQTITASWWVVFVPIWVLFVLAMIPIVKSMISQIKQQNDEGEKMGHGMMMCALLFILVVISPIFVLAARLEGSFSSIYVLLPWFVLVGCSLIFVALCICCYNPQQASEDHPEHVESPQGGPEASPQPYYNDDNMA